MMSLSVFFSTNQKQSIKILFFWKREKQVPLINNHFFFFLRSDKFLVIMGSRLSGLGSALFDSKRREFLGRDGAGWGK